jgi:hypothetical protein
MQARRLSIANNSNNYGSSLMKTGYSRNNSVDLRSGGFSEGKVLSKTGFSKSEARGISFGEVKRPANLEWDRLVVFRKGMIIQDAHYLVELSYNQRGLFISLHSMEGSSKSLILEIENPEKVREILSAFNSDFEYLARHIKVVKGMIKIRKPLEEQAPHLND